MGASEDFIEEGCHFFFSLVIYFSLKEQEFPFLVWFFFSSPLPFLPIFREMLLDLFFFEVSKVCFIFSEMWHSSRYSALLSSYTAEIPGGKIDKRKVNPLKGQEHLVFIVTDILIYISFNKNFDVSRWDIEHRGRVIFVNSFENLIIINRRLFAIRTVMNKS